MVFWHRIHHVYYMVPYQFMLRNRKIKSKPPLVQSQIFMNVKDSKQEHTKSAEGWDGKGLEDCTF